MGSGWAVDGSSCQGSRIIQLIVLRLELTDISGPKKATLKHLELLYVILHIKPFKCSHFKIT